MKIKFKKWMTNFSLMIGGLFFSLLILEGLTRLFLPISPGAQKVTLQGKKIRDWLIPGCVYYQVSTEYNAITTITEQGYRAPKIIESPDVVFLGDSFTFGQGLNDEETFPYIYAQALKNSCANLGIPGVGTIEEINMFEKYLENLHWRPKQVKLFLLAMTASFSAGNDLADNFFYSAKTQNNISIIESKNLVNRSAISPGMLEGILGYREILLRYSNFLRVMKFYFGPLLRSKLTQHIAAERLDKALKITFEQLSRLDELSRKYTFDYQIYLLHPVQDIIQKTYIETLNRLNEISPVPIQSTAHLFEHEPQNFYYSYDGHFNALGSLKIAEFLISQDQPNSSN